MTANNNDPTSDPRFVAGEPRTADNRSIVDPDESQAGPDFAPLAGSVAPTTGHEAPTQAFAANGHRAAPARVEPGRFQPASGDVPTTAFASSTSGNPGMPSPTGTESSGAYSDYQQDMYHGAASTPVLGAHATEAPTDTTSDGESAEAEDTVPTGPRGTIDLGLLFLRLGLGLTMAAHGLDKLFGVFGVSNLDGVRSMLESLGFREALLTPLAYGLGATELVAGALVVLGFMTPVAAAALLGTALTASLAHMQMNSGQYVFFMMDDAGSGLEFLHMITFGAAALVLTGPGRIAVDLPFGWATRPRWGSFLWLLIGVGSAPLVWWAFNTNPIPWPWG